MKLFSKKEPKQLDPRELLRNVSFEQQVIFANTMALRQVVREKEKAYVFLASTKINIGSFDVENISNCAGTMFAEVQTDLARDFAAATALLRTLEASEAFNHAKNVIEPILAAIAEHDAERQSKKTAALAAAGKLRELKAKRQAEAEAAIEQDPTVLDAVRELQQAEKAAAQ
jgi:hypothetical protein